MAGRQLGGFYGQSGGGSSLAVQAMDTSSVAGTYISADRSAQSATPCGHPNIATASTPISTLLLAGRHLPGANVTATVPKRDIPSYRLHGRCSHAVPHRRRWVLKPAATLQATERAKHGFYLATVPLCRSSTTPLMPSHLPHRTPCPTLVATLHYLPTPLNVVSPPMLHVPTKARVARGPETHS